MRLIDDSMTAERASAELREAADRYLRVRVNGGDLRGEYPLLKAALVTWTAFYPKQAFRIGEYWSLSLDCVGEPFLLRLDPATAPGSKTKGTCVPNMAHRKNKAKAKGGAA